jgi:DNA-binding IclR family transcriptional regulator
MKHYSNPEARPGTQSVVRAIIVLKTLAKSTESYGITELGTATGLSKATVFRLLGALETEGMVSRDSTSGSYRLGPELITLGASALSTANLRSVAHDQLTRLSQETGETSTLEVLLSGEVLILDEVQGRFLLGTTPEIGRHWPAHATSTGKLLLAFAPPLPTTMRLVKSGPRTIVSRTELAKELARVRRVGYAIAVDELEAGFVALAAPIRNHTGAVVAAMSINGPAVRLTAARRKDLLTPLCDAAGRVSRALGAAPSVLPAPTTRQTTGAPQ